jgi:hypothetical protein
MPAPEAEDEMSKIGPFLWFNAPRPFQAMRGTTKLDIAKLQAAKSA